MHYFRFEYVNKNKFLKLKRIDGNKTEITPNRNRKRRKRKPQNKSFFCSDLLLTFIDEVLTSCSYFPFPVSACDSGALYGGIQLNEPTNKLDVEMPTFCLSCT